MHNPQKIFNIGLPKTGTSSLARASNLLGINCLHNPYYLRDEVMRGNYRFDSLTDWQAIANFGEHFYPQLDQTYPGSKFILTERELQSWLKSIERQISGSDGMAPRKPIRPKDLLIMNISAGDGWEKLCSFLDCPVPDGVPFPVVRPAPST